jgi:hypothetical protein
VFDIMGKEPLVEVAIALEKAALSDEYFISRKLYPNVDFYSGLIYKAMGFPTGADILSLCVWCDGDPDAHAQTCSLCCSASRAP